MLDPRLADPTPWAQHADAERAARLSTMAWAIVAQRLPYRTHREALEARRAAGLVMDEANFARIASGIPR